jgi:hypothetical protein
MDKKLTQWISAVIAEMEHTTNACQADSARRQVAGKNTLVEKHLRRIVQRECILSEFAGYIASRSALNIDEESDETK